jgi:broad specificity phosphatase PhoE
VTTFYLIRHGAIFQAPDLTDPPLSLLGWQQAQATAAYLKNRPVKHVYTSPLQRTKETAAHIALPHQLEVIEDIRLRERMNWGDLPGQTFVEFVAMWERANRDRSYVPPVGDSAHQAGQRLEDFIRDLQQKYPHDEIVAVAHGGIIADFLLNVFSLEELGKINPAFPRQPYSGDLMRTCSITILHYHGEQYNLEKIALIEHLNGIF